MVTEANAIHVREHGSILAAAERRALVWMAERLPRWVNSDHLTLLGFLAMALAGASYWAARWNPHALILVVFALALNWFGDSLDGTLARVRNRQRPRYGYYVDHVIDLAGPCFVLGGLALSGYMSPLIAFGLLVAFLLVMAEVFLATHVNRVFRLAVLRVGPTELRIVLAIGTLYLLHRPWVMLGNLGPYRLFDIGGVVATVGLALILVVSAIRNTRALYLEETLP
jgi:archaetidylinositol phosphate synthase